MIKNSESIWQRIEKFLASLKLAVIIIIAIAAAASAGTFIEAKYDSALAKKLVYNSIWMYFIMGALTINLTAVMVDRWPWKKRHIPFIFAHIGIIVLLFGAVLTMQWGLDGSLRVEVGGENRFVVVDDTEISIYASFTGDRFTKLYQKSVDFFKSPPKSAPIEISAQNTQIKIVDYESYVLPRREVIETTDAVAGGAMRFHLENPKVGMNVVDWMVQRHSTEEVTQDFGPAQFHFGTSEATQHDRNEVFFKIPKGGGQSLEYVVYHRGSEKAFAKGTLKEGESFEPGWMGFKIRLLRYLPKAQEQWDIKIVERPSPLTTSAVKVRVTDDSGTHDRWLLLNDVLKFFSKNSAFVVSYGNRKVELGFPVILKDFQIDRYQGTMRASAYKSLVEIPGAGEHEISMNEPLKYQGLTFYQASFQEGMKGEPTASIFSVNADPGRPFKYIGSIIMSLGIILMFYFKRAFQS